MLVKENILREIRAAFEHDPRINVRRHPIHLQYHNGALTLEGEVATLAAKRLALERAKSLNGMHNIVDRLRVMPGEVRGDGAIRATLCEFLLHEPTLTNYAVSMHHKGNSEFLRSAPQDSVYAIDVTVAQGVVMLNGRVGSLSHKRVAGVLAWWTPGRRDVVNALEVFPMEYDNDHEIADALRLVLEMDPMIHADQVRASVCNNVVTLQGLLATEAEKKMAEQDAWYIFGVTDVVNQIIVRH